MKTSIAIALLFSGIVAGIAGTSVWNASGLNFPWQQTATRSPPIPDNNNDHRSTPANSTGLPLSTPDTGSVADNSAGNPHHKQAQPDREWSFSELSQTNSQSTIAEQQLLLANIAQASLPDVKMALADAGERESSLYKHQWVVRLLLQRWVELDPDDAFNTVSEKLLSSSFDRRSPTTSFLLESLALLQPDMLLGWLRNTPTDQIDPEGLMSAYNALATSAPEQTMQLILDDTSQSTARYGGLESVLFTWADSDPEAVLQWLYQHGDDDLTALHGPGIISQLLEYNPHKARELSANFPQIDTELFFQYREIQELADTDPLAALQRAQSISSTDDADNARFMIFSAWGAADPIAALDYIASQTGQKQRQMYASTVIGSIMEMAFENDGKREELMLWADTLPPDLQVMVREPLIVSWMERQPEQTIDWLINQPDNNQKTMLLSSVAWMLPEQDLQQAMQLYTTADSSTKSALSPGILQKLYENDPDEAWQWYDQLLDVNAKSQAWQMLIMNTASENPQQALELAVGSAESIDMLPIIAFEYPDETESWLQYANVSEEQELVIRQSLDQRRQIPSYYPAPHYPPTGLYPSTQYRVENGGAIYFER